MPKKSAKRQKTVPASVLDEEEKKKELIDKYFAALANFYGRISLKRAFDIIIEQNKGQIELRDIISYALYIIVLPSLPFKIQEAKSYKIVNIEESEDELPSNMQDIDFNVYGLMEAGEEDFEIFYDRAEKQFGKPYFVPPKAELLKYADPYYCEHTIEMELFAQYLDSLDETLHWKSNAGYTAEEIAEEAVLDVRYSLDVNYCYDPVMFLVFLSKHVPLPEDMELAGEIREYIDCHLENIRLNTRCRINNGYTVPELKELYNGVKTIETVHFATPEEYKKPIQKYKKMAEDFRKDGVDEGHIIRFVNEEKDQDEFQKGQGVEDACARKEWERYPESWKEAVLNNAFCAKCSKSSSFRPEYIVRKHGNNLVIEGQCKKCGERMVRVAD